MNINGKRQMELLNKMSFVRMGGTAEEMAAELGLVKVVVEKR